MTDHPADPPSPLTERGSIEDDIRVLDKALDEAIAQAVNLGALVRTDPRIKGTPMALEVKLRELRAALRARLVSSPAPAGLDVAVAAFLDYFDNQYITYDNGDGTSIIRPDDYNGLDDAVDRLRAATRPAVDAPAPAGLDERVLGALRDAAGQAHGFMHYGPFTDCKAAICVRRFELSRAATRPAEDEQ